MVHNPIQFDEATRDGLRSLRRLKLPHRSRDRLGIVMPSSVAWAPGRGATHPGYCRATARAALAERVVDDCLDLLPPSAPTFDEIEPAFRQVIRFPRTGIVPPDRPEPTRPGTQLGRPLPCTEARDWRACQRDVSHTPRAFVRS